jgi:DNA-binding MarR family transcriptional regulator
MRLAEEELSPSQPTSQEATETTRLVLELIHTGYGIRSTIAHAPLLAEGSRSPSPQAVRAAINLYLSGELSMSEIAASVGRSNAWASRAIDELIDLGLAQRFQDPDDRRVFRVRLVPEAVSRVEQAYNWRGDAIARALAGLNPSARAAVRRFLGRAIAELSAE